MLKKDEIVTHRITISGTLFGVAVAGAFSSEVGTS
jgi:hypothetical protein